MTTTNSEDLPPIDMEKMTFNTVEVNKDTVTTAATSKLLELSAYIDQKLSNLADIAANMNWEKSDSTSEMIRYTDMYREELIALIQTHDATREREIDNHILKIAMSADQKPDGYFGDDSRKAVLATLHGLHHYMDDRLATLTNPKQQTGGK